VFFTLRLVDLIDQPFWGRDQEEDVQDDEHKVEEQSDALITFKVYILHLKLSTNKIFYKSLKSLTNHNNEIGQEETVVLFLMGQDDGQVQEGHNQTGLK